MFKKLISRFGDSQDLNQDSGYIKCDECGCDKKEVEKSIYTDKSGVYGIPIDKVICEKCYENAKYGGNLVKWTKEITAYAIIKVLLVSDKRFGECLRVLDIVEDSLTTDKFNLESRLIKLNNNKHDSNIEYKIVNLSELPKEENNKGENIFISPEI